ncbi:MAG: universal stress protein [Desulfamplus sp.]|nr:universal stress protein [Desulfamplus sp.]
MQTFCRILFPVSLTEMSPVVAPYVISMAEKYFAEIHMVHVVRRMNFYADSFISQPSETDIKRHASNFEQERITLAQQNLESFKTKYIGDKQVSKTSVVSGTHYKKLIEYVEENDIDLIIMGSGRNIQTHLFGSVADKVAKMAKCPVMMIRVS